MGLRHYHHSQVEDFGSPRQNVSKKLYGQEELGTRPSLHIRGVSECPLSPEAGSLHSFENTDFCLKRSVENRAFPPLFISQDSGYLQPAYLNE